LQQRALARLAQELQQHAVREQLRGAVQLASEAIALALRRALRAGSAPIYQQTMSSRALRVS